MQTIINNTNYTKWAIDELISESFDSNLAPLNSAGERVDYSDYIHDVVATNEGVLIPSEYDDNGKIIDYKIAFTKEQLMKTVLELVKENESEAYNEVVNVNTDKN